LKQWMQVHAVVLGNLVVILKEVAQGRALLDTVGVWGSLPTRLPILSIG